ncbi:Reverse transcriptase [Theobroma cacao]|nr:Reverse transcriptase [Theobroma cacao]
MQDELNALVENKTWEVVVVPSDFPVIAYQWVYKTKFLADDNIDKFKARLVAKGYNQQEDDILVASSTAQVETEVKQYLKSKFKLKVLGSLSSKLASTPIEYNHKIATADKDDLLADGTVYRQLIGKLIYLTFTRPDIVYRVQVLEQFMDKPRNVHLQAAFKIIRYLKGSPG